MNDGRRPDEREARLDALRREAQAGARVSGAGIRPAGAPFPVPHAGAVPPTARTGYYGRPLLKRPTWTWEVPAYFFVGGAAGAAALIGAVAGRTQGGDDLARDARWMAAVGGALSPPLLISDLGRPGRFLNMFRVFKLQSPMSVGSWTLLAFGSVSGAAAAADLLLTATDGAAPVRLVRDAADLLAGATGLALSTYTGVLVGATSIPVWSENMALLPLHFSASAMASAVGMLELLGHRPRALHVLGLAAALAETAAGARLETSGGPALGAVRHGPSGALMRMAGLLSGPIPLALRLLGWRSRRLRSVAATSAVAGALLTRFAWIAAGRASADDPRVPLGLDEEG